MSPCNRGHHIWLADHKWYMRRLYAVCKLYVHWRNVIRSGLVRSSLKPSDMVTGQKDTVKGQHKISRGVMRRGVRLTSGVLVVRKSLRPLCCIRLANSGIGSPVGPSSARIYNMPSTSPACCYQQTTRQDKISLPKWWIYRVAWGYASLLWISALHAAHMGTIHTTFTTYQLKVLALVHQETL